MDKALQRSQTRERVKRYRERNSVTRDGTGGVTPIIRFENGSYLHVDKLVEPKSRALLTYLSENLKYPEGLRVGVFGPTIKECKKLLEVTA